jgi:ABC-type multidrug transport system permease subunit
MHITDTIWWAYTAFVALAALFFLVFAFLVREKGGRDG